MKKTDEEIRQEARNYWQRIVDLVAERHAQDFIRKGYRPIGPPGTPMPDFKSLKIFTAVHEDLLGDSVLDYDEFFKSGSVYYILAKVRKRL